MRADASRNRDALLRAARELLVEEGLDVPLEAVARCAGVSPATLYRRFPDREALLRDVALLSLSESRQIAEAARAALDQAPDEAAAEATWLDSLQSFASEWIGVHLLTLLRTTSPVEGAAVEQARRAALTAFDELLAVLRERGLVREDLSSFEVWTLLLAVARPLAGAPSSVAEPLVRRHLQVVAAGLRSDAVPVTGAVVSQAEAEQMAEELAARRADSRNDQASA